ncbi:MAG: NADH-quinone oxidoreductase subunit M [Gammaproteobacteria bacterium]|nr:NADH-quinone oxidoreductase subunit M [Gammaproteobacteria bacterium]
MIINEIQWASQSAYPILGILQLVPLVATILVLLLKDSKILYPMAVALAVIELSVAIDLFWIFDQTQSVLQLAEKWVLVSPLAYHVAVDGMSVLFVLLTSLLTLMVVIYAGVRQLAFLSRLMAIIFAVQTTLQSMFVTQDLLWFTLLSGVQLFLIGYLLKTWANAPREDLAMQRYMQFMGTGLLLLLIALVMLGWNYADLNQGSWSFNLQDLVTAPIPSAVQSVIFFLLFYGLAIRIPLFPLHGWLPVIAEHGTVAIVGVFMLGLKVGVYGLLRFVFPLVPDAVMQWHEYVVTFAVVGIFYAALLALMQDNLRRLLAYAVVSHTSVLMIGLFSLNHFAFQGSVMLSVNFGLATSGLLFMSGFVFRRTRTLSLSRLGGLFDHIPLIGATFLIAGLSIIGMPGTPGFDAVHLIMEAAIERFGALITIAAALGNVAAAAFLLWAFQRAFLAPLKEGVTQRPVEPTTAMEFLLIAMMIVVLLTAGFYSEPWLELIEGSFVNLEALFEHPVDAEAGSMSHEGH